MLRWSMLRCPMLRCPMLRCPMLRCPMLRCPMLRCPMLRCPMLRRSMLFGPHFFQALLRQACRWRVGKLRRHLLERTTRRRIVLQLIVAVADLEQRVRELARAGIFLHHPLKCGERLLKLLVHVIRLSEPILRIIGQSAVGIGREEGLKSRYGAIVLAGLQEVEGGLIGDLVGVG